MKQISLLLILLFFILSLSAQKSFYIEPHFSPLVIPIGNVGFEEAGIGYYEFNYSQKTTQEYGLNVGWNTKSKFYWGFGASYKKISNQFSYEVLDPLYHETVISSQDNGFLNYHFFGFRTFLGYHLNDRFSVKLIADMNEPLKIERYEIQDNNWLVTYFNVEEGYGVGLSKYEQLRPSGDGLQYIIPEIQFSTKIYKNLQVNIGLKYKWTKGKRPEYYYIISGNNADYRDQSYWLNDVRFNRKYAFVYFGFSYPLHLFSKKKTQ